MVGMALAKLVRDRDRVRKPLLDVPFWLAGSIDPDGAGHEGSS
jgi:hypothetical protein